MFSKSQTDTSRRLHNYFPSIVFHFCTPKLPTAHDNSLFHISSSSSHTPLWVERPVCAVQSVFLCVNASPCLSLHCLWFPLISLKSYVFCHVLVFWMLAYGCHLFSPPALLPPCLPHPNSSLFACCSSCSTPPSTTAMSSPCVLRHCAQHWTCSSWLVSLLSSLCLSCSLFFFNLYICLCSMPAFTVTQQTLLCQAAQPGNVSFVLCVRFMLAILKQVPVRLHFTLIAVMLSNIYKNPSNSSYFSCTCRMVSPTNQLQCFPEGATEEYHPHWGQGWLYLQH